MAQAKINVTITVRPAPGKADELEELFTEAAAIIAETEPGTLYWFATRQEDDTFVIIDGFENEAGVEAHFAGKVAATLQQKAATLVEGGWENGVAKNVVPAPILSQTGLPG